MRHIGSVQNETQAKVFGDFLIARGIRNQIERESENDWPVWIHDDDQIPAAQGWLIRFQANPGAPEFQSASSDAAKVRQAEAEALAAYRKRIRTRRSVFPKFGGYGIGVLTYVLIIASIVVSASTGTVIPGQAENSKLLDQLFMSGRESAGTHFLPEVFKGEVWRLFTPIFIHFGPLHLLFNMMWLYQLGCMIEARQGSLRLAALVVVIALCSNIAQYYVLSRFSMSGITVYLGGRATFGGMSGVVYGLAGYVWIRGRDDRGSGLYLDPQSVTILLIWLVFCYTGLVGPVANTAHLVGLIVGMAWGWISARLTPKRTD